MNDKTALIIAGGTDILSPEKVLNIKDYSFILCADSGYDNCIKMGLSPDMVIGDMDSVKGNFKSAAHIKVPAEKDLTDTQLCIEYLKKSGYSHVILLCALGGRSDHFFANLMLLDYAQKLGIFLEIISNSERIFLCNSNCLLDKRHGNTFSVFPIGGNCTGVNIQGAKYPLCDACLYYYETLGISNEITDNFAKISIACGKAIIMQINMEK